MKTLPAYITIFLFLASFIAEAQVSSKKVLKHLDKMEFEKAERIIIKYISKDSTSPGGKYLYSKLFLSPSFDRFDTDSANYYILSSLAGFSTLNEKRIKSLAKQKIDSASILEQKRKVDSAAFVLAKSKNTEQTYNHFLEAYHGALQTPKAIKLRDKAAYKSAEKENSSNSYLKFINTYPNALQIPEAREKYDKLLFKESTGDQKLNSFIDFLKENPQTPYRRLTEKNIFEIATADNSPESYYWFIKNYTNSIFAKHAIDYLYHILKEQEKLHEFESTLSDDSLRNAIALEQSPLLLIYQNSRYGFIDTSGKIVIPPTYDQTNDEYLCGQIEEDYLIVGKHVKKVIGRSGTEIYYGHSPVVEDLGYGLLAIEDEGKVHLIHKTGRQITSNVYDEASIINGQYILVRQENKWGLLTFSGREVFQTQFEKISLIGHHIAFSKQGKIALASPKSIAAIVNKIPLYLEFKYDEVSLINQQLYHVKSGQKEGILNNSLAIAVAIDNHRIKSSMSHVSIATNSTLTILDEQLQVCTKFQTDSVQYHENWLTIKQDSGWVAYNTFLNQTIGNTAYNSVSFPGCGAALLQQTDSSILAFQNGTLLYFKGTPNITRLNSKSTFSDQPCLLIDNAEDKKSIYDHLGKKFHEGSFDKAHLFGKDYIVIEKNNKKGLVNLEGKLLLSPRYDAIGNYSNGSVSLLSRRKFGLYRAYDGTFIQPVYSKNIIPYNQSLFIVQKSGSYGLIRNNGRSITKFEFDEIKFWNDSSALVKKENNWYLYDFTARKSTSAKAKSIAFVKQSPEENIAILTTAEGKGVFSSKHGEVISATFNDIINLGSTETPIYFAEKYLEQADYYVVIYFDQSGNIIKRQAYDADDYEYIYCGF